VVTRSNSEYLENFKEEYSYLKKRAYNLFLVKTLFEHILNDRSNGRKMFNVVTKTWNPVTGCLHNCSYCWARDLATTKLRNSHRYREGFCPSLNKEEFRHRFNKGDFIFVSDMGDLFGDFIPDEWILKVIEHAKQFPQTYFLFLTKNPAKYEKFLDNMPMNAILGATIETNRDKEYSENAVSRAPSPSARYTEMKKLEWDKKFISIEPVLDFDFTVFYKWIEEIFPFMVYIGYDNYFKRLSEPPLSKTTKFAEELSKLMLVVKKSIRPAWFESLELSR
jgi:DNA repair photolyase